MSDDPKRLPAPKRMPPIAFDEEIDPIRLPGNVRITFARSETLLAISPELMQARAHEAQSMSDQANSQYAVPAVEKTKQVRFIGLVVVAVAVACVVGCVAKPEASASIAAIAAIVTGVFGGIYALDIIKKPSPPPST